MAQDKHKALSSTFSTAKKKKEKNKGYQEPNPIQNKTVIIAHLKNN
jgi:hypothetical protein